VGATGNKNKIEVIFQIEIDVSHSPTILPHILQVTLRRRIHITDFFACESGKDKENGQVKIALETDMEKIRLVMSLLVKLVEVSRVNKRNLKNHSSNILLIRPQNKSVQ